MHGQILSCVPGAFVLAPGGPRDYRELEHFHYQPSRPRTWCAVWVVKYSCDPLGETTTDARQRIVAVGVLSWPVPVARERESFFGLRGKSYRERILFANANLRTISRVVVHPQFRSMGLASMLVRKLCEVCPTRYVEAMAIMGRVHPFFGKAGMMRIEEEAMEEEASRPLRPWYYLYDRGADSSGSSCGSCRTGFSPSAISAAG